MPANENKGDDMKDNLLSEDTLHLRLPFWLKERLRKRAERELSTMSQVVRKIIAGEFADEMTADRHREANVEP